MINVADSQPAEPRSFRAFRSLSRALRFMQKLDDRATVRIVSYGLDSRDIRAVVNFFGSNPRPTRIVRESHLVMIDGRIVDRRLPVICS